MSKRVRIPTGELAMLLRGWPRSGVSLVDSLTVSLRDLIASGDLISGGQLPSERSLASALNISRTTVTRSFERLDAEGWLDREQGSGTWIKSTLQARANPLGVRLRGFEETDSDGSIDFTSAASVGLPLVAEAWARLSAGSSMTHLVATHGYSPRGLPDLVEGICHYYWAGGIDTVHEQVLVTNGSQHATTLIASMLISPGDVVVVEEPTYRGAIDVFRAAGARLVSVTSDEEGINVGELSNALRSHNVTFVYVLPTIHNPTGSALVSSRRQRFIDTVVRHGMLVVEDASPIDTYFGETPLRPLAADLPIELVVTFGSATKLFWGGLRVGWIRATRERIDRLMKVRSGGDIGGSLPSQALVAALMPDVRRARELRRNHLHASYVHLTSLLQEELPEWAWWPVAGGGSLWVTLPNASALPLAASAAHLGVRFTPGPTFSAFGRQQDRIRLPFANSSADRTEGVRRLAQAWSTLKP